MRTYDVKILLVAAMVAAVALPAVAGDDRPTAGFRAEHAGIKEHLRHLDSKVGALAGATGAERRKTMVFVVKFLTEHILTHAA